MTKLIIFGIVAILFAVFATQNTESVTVWFFEYNVPYVPVYMLVLSSVFFGLILSWIITFVQSVSAGMTIRGKENKIRATEKEVADLTRRVHQLELENTRLKAGVKEDGDEDSL
jgi:lipopolysaccharide assembly protein A